METLKLKVELSELYRLKEFINIHYKEDIQIRLVVEEIFVNIVNYSGADYIIVNLELDDCLKLEFIDNGNMFNPILKEDPTAPESLDDVQIGGLGIMLVKNYADDLSYVYENNENHFTIIKNV